MTLREAWERRNKQLKQCSELQLFLRDAELVDATNSGQEAFLSNDDLGVREGGLHVDLTFMSPKPQ